MRIVVTGHRPERLKGTLDGVRMVPYSKRMDDALLGIAIDVLTELSLEHQIDHVVSGMALGWDTACAQAAVDLGMPLLAAMPFRGMGDNSWDMRSRIRRDRLLKKAEHVTYVSDGLPASHKFNLRDRWMVAFTIEKEGGLCLALWDGIPNGGTVEYAKAGELEIVNAWDRCWASKEEKV